MKNKLKLLFLFIGFIIVGTTLLNAQNCYIRLEDASGFDPDTYQEELETAACDLILSFPTEYQDQFKVFSFGFYSLTENMNLEPEASWEKVKLDAASKSRYYLLFGKVTNRKGIYSKFLVDLKLPDQNVFYCIDQLSPNLRENLILSYQSEANIVHESNNKNPSLYYHAEIEVMNQLGEYIEGLKDCCDYQYRSASSCSSCVLSASQYERVLDDLGLISINVDKVMDNTSPVMGEEEIGFRIEINGNSINLDEAITSFKQEIQSDFPGTSIKIYPISYSESCSNYNEVITSFMTENVDIGVLIGVVGVDGKEGSLYWQMISDDDIEPTPTTFDSDSCYYFNQNKLFTNKEYCTGNITPRGIIRNFNGQNFDHEFRFSDPEITPRTLTTDPINDGEFVPFGITDEPLLNKVLLMTKADIFARLAEAIPNQEGGTKPGAFDYHAFAPWSFYQESSGFDAPFDYSTKNFFLDRENYLFITDDGDNIVGHNFRNMGNFLWGAATYIMGLPQVVAISGAHLNNLFTEEGWNLDSPDDQYAIKLGRYYAKKVNWKTIYGGKNNIFRK